MRLYEYRLNMDSLNVLLDGTFILLQRRQRISVVEKDNFDIVLDFFGFLKIIVGPGVIAIIECDFPYRIKIREFFRLLRLRRTREIKVFIQPQTRDRRCLESASSSPPAHRVDVFI